MNVRLTPDGAVHVKRFSWHTACGKDIDEDSSAVSDTRDSITCGKCKTQRKYLYVGEISSFGVLIDRDERQTKLAKELHGMWYPDRDDAADFVPYIYQIKIFSPFQATGKECVSMVAHLPDDDAAINFCEMWVWWRIGLMNGKQFGGDELDEAAPPPTIHAAQPESAEAVTP